MLKKNEIVTIEITDITSEGNGVGRYEGFALFVPWTAVGDIAEVRVVKVLKNYGYGKLESLIKPSPDRILDSACPVYQRCGGCSFRHLSYDSECDKKNTWIVESLRRIAGISVIPEPFAPAPDISGYRNKAQYPVGEENGEIVIGFYAKRSHRILSGDGCDLQPPVFSSIVQKVKGLFQQYQVPVYHEENHTGCIRHLYLRYAETTNQVMVCFVIRTPSLPHENEIAEDLCKAFPNIAGVLCNINPSKGNVILGDACRTIKGQGFITDTLCGVRVQISPLSFYQVNRKAAENLYQCASDFAGLTGNETLVDFYCGAGTIGLSMASQVKQLIGVEIVPQAVEDAKENAQRNHIPNTRFLCADAGEAANQLLADGVNADIIVVDPPRKGCSIELIDSIVKINPEKIVMISCNPSTMARDCGILAQHQYSVSRVKGFDLFPRTCHCEVCVELCRK